MKLISIFGSTGSIGKNTIKVIRNAPQNFKVLALVAGNDVETLIAQALELKPQYVVIENEKHFSHLKESLQNPKNCQILCGKKSIIEVAKIKCDLMVLAIVGVAAMLPGLAAIEVGSNIALANKESLVCAGNFINKAAQKSGSKIIPVDSEHNAIFQIFEKNNLSQIDSVTLTASGGPFFDSDIDFNKITVEQALKHPNWSMGAKISIDSATMMNKGLEMIEAFYLFPIKKDQIKILVHPQSIIHAMVDYKDGSTLAMLSNPDMQVPISYALAYPNRMAINHKKLDLAKLQNLSFFAPNYKKFPALKLCHNALEIGYSAPAVLNAANEVAVKRFLNKEINFVQITAIVSDILQKIDHKNCLTIEQLLEFDQKARLLAQEW